MPSKEIRRKGALGALLLLLVLLAAAFAARVLAVSASHGYPLFDEIAELDLARQYAARGTLGTIRCFIQGECREDNRHPLYPMLLASVATDAPQDYAKGKLLSLACGLLLLAAVTTAAWRLCGESGALAVAALLAFSPGAAVLSQGVAADALFTAFYVAALALLAQAGESPWEWAAFGACAGLAYLTKGSGHFLFLSAFAVAGARWGRRAFTSSALYAAAAAFVLTAGFLLWRNAHVWGNPFHNINSQEVWLDEWKDFWILSSSPEWARVGPRWYFAAHSPLVALSRFAKGAILVAARLPRAFGTGPFAAATETGLPLLLLALFGLYRRVREGRYQEVAAFSATNLLLLAAFAWAAQPMGALLRYLFPIAASLLPFSFIGARRLAERSSRFEATFERPEAFKIFLVVAAVAMIFLSRAGLRDPLLFWDQPMGWSEAGDWLKAHASPGGYLIDPASTFSDWARAPDLRRPYPFSQPAPDLLEYAQARGITAAVLDEGAVPRSAVAEKLGPSDAQGPVRFLGWPRCLVSDEARLLVFSPACAARD